MAHLIRATVVPDCCSRGTARQRPVPHPRSILKTQPPLLCYVPLVLAANTTPLVYSGENRRQITLSSSHSREMQRNPASARIRSSGQRRTGAIARASRLHGQRQASSCVCVTDTGNEVPESLAKSASTSNICIPNPRHQARSPSIGRISPSLLSAVPCKSRPRISASSGKGGDPTAP